MILLGRTKNNYDLHLCIQKQQNLSVTELTCHWQQKVPESAKKTPDRFCWTAW